MASLTARSNPLNIHGTAMRPNILLMAKLVTLCFLLDGQLGELSDHLVPFVDAFRHLGSPTAFQRVLQVVFLLAALSLFGNRYVRVASGTLGAVILIGIAASMKYYENNRLYTGLILVLAGLEDPRDESWLLRWQIVLLYFAAALNKVLTADWRDGHFFESWYGYFHASIYRQISTPFPHRVLGALVGWTTILTEFLLALGFTRRRMVPLVMMVGVAYHSALVLTMNRTFGMFWYSALLSYLAFVNWPTEPPVVRWGQAGWLARAGRGLQRSDLTGAFRWQPTGSSGLEMLSGQTVHCGGSALVRVTLYNPVSYFTLSAVAAALHSSPRGPAVLVLVVLGAVAVTFALEHRRGVRAVPAAAADAGPWSLVRRGASH